MAMPEPAVLFVCLGNICRSPLAEAAFRAEAQSWLAAHAPAHELTPGIKILDTEEADRGRAWMRELFKGGWSGLTFPKALGGRGLSGIEAVIFSEEEAKYHLPKGPFTSIGTGMALPVIAKHGADCWLVNTGWTGGKEGVGRRMPIRVTRRLLTAALDGSLNKATFRTDPYFGFAVPSDVPGVEPHILTPHKTWPRFFTTVSVGSGAEVVAVAGPTPAPICPGVCLGNGGWPVAGA